MKIVPLLSGKKKKSSQERKSVALSSFHPFISFVDSVRKLHECLIFILELKSRIWWNYLCIILVQKSKAFQVTDDPYLTILINFKNIHIDPFYFPYFWLPKIGIITVEEMDEQKSSYYPEGCWEICMFIFIYFLHFSALPSKVA